MIVYCSRDLIFATKISSTAQELGVLTRPARDRDTLLQRLDQVDDGRQNGPVAAVLMDLEMGGLALEMLHLIKEHDPGTPVIAFGSHVATELLQAARTAGANYVMPRSQFVVQLPTFLTRFGTGQDEIPDAP